MVTGHLTLLLLLFFHLASFSNNNSTLSGLFKATVAGNNGSAQTFQFFLARYSGVLLLSLFRYLCLCARQQQTSAVLWYLFYAQSQSEQQR